MDIEPKPGYMIVIEGMDGSGKSSVTKIVDRIMREELGQRTLVSRELGGTPIAEQCRTLAVQSRPDERTHPLTRVFLALAARNQHYTNVIKPGMDDGKVIILDRYSPSTLVLQGFVDNQIDVLRAILKQHSVRSTFGQDPEYIIYLDVDAEIAFARGAARKNLDNDAYKTSLDVAKKSNWYYQEVLGHTYEPGSEYDIDGKPNWHRSSHYPNSTIFQVDVNTFDDVEEKLRKICCQIIENQSRKTGL